MNPTRGEVERAQDVTLEALGDAIELHDLQTHYHCMRVTSFAIALARAMSLSGDQCRVLGQGAFLHDFGKLATAPGILRKTGALTPEEKETMREHCGLGYHKLRKVPFLADAAETVFAHHENWDGSGYPRNLRAGEIPLGARVVAVVNTLDWIISDQPCRAAQPVKAAREEIVRCSGQQFDPDVVKAFLEVPESIWHSLRDEL